MYVRSCFSHVQLFAALWTVAHQAPLSMGFSRQAHWSGLLCPLPGDLPDPGIPCASPALTGEFFITSTTYYLTIRKKKKKGNDAICKIMDRPRRYYA